MLGSAEGCLSEHRKALNIIEILQFIIMGGVKDVSCSKLVTTLKICRINSERQEDESMLVFFVFFS